MDNPLPDWGENIAENDISFMLAPMLAAYRQNIDKMVQPFGISAGQTPLVVALSRQDGMLQKELADVLEVTPPSLAGMLARMERAGLVRRRRRSRDRRTCHVYLTERGRMAAKRISAVIRFVNRSNLAGFSEAEKREFAQYMRRMRHNIEKQRTELKLMMLDTRAPDSL